MLTPDEISAQGTSGEGSAVCDGDRITVGVGERRISTSSPRSRNPGSFGENATIREHELWRPALPDVRFVSRLTSHQNEVHGLNQFQQPLHWEAPALCNADVKSD